MQGGVHLLSGLLLASLGRKREYKIASVFGAIIPDIDIFVAAIAYLIIGDEAQYLHRSFTHSFFTIGILFLLFAFVDTILKKYKSEEKISKVNFMYIGIGISIGMLTHTILDLFYLVKVAAFWPFSKKLVGWPLVSDKNLSILALKILQTTDFLTDILFFLLPLTLISHKEKKNKNLTKFLFAYIFVDIVFIITYIFVAIYIPLSYETFLVYLYYPGTFFLLFSIFSPLILKEIIAEFSFENYSMIIIVSLFVFSQLLFSLFLI